MFNTILRPLQRLIILPNETRHIQSDSKTYSEIKKFVTIIAKFKNRTREHKVGKTQPRKPLKF